MEDVRTLMVFCEGSHDVAFCRSVFRHCIGIDKVSWKFSEYPSPLNQLFRTSMKKHAQKDLSLDMAHKFFLPDRTLYSEKLNWLILLFNAGGKSNMSNPMRFLSDFLPLLYQCRVFSDGAKTAVSDVKYIFLYDADHEGAEKVFDACQRYFAQIDGKDFMSLPLVADTDNPKVAKKDNKAVYVWGDKESGKGTLEDILFPMFEKDQAGIVTKASGFIDNCFQWETRHEKAQRRIAEIAKRRKAIICCSGQRRKPGLPMNTIIKEAKLISVETFNNNTEVNAFAHFITTFCNI